MKSGKIYYKFTRFRRFVSDSQQIYNKKDYSHFISEKVCFVYHHLLSEKTTLIGKIKTVINKKNVFLIQCWRKRETLPHQFAVDQMTKHLKNLCQSNVTLTCFHTFPHHCVTLHLELIHVTAIRMDEHVSFV